MTVPATGWYVEIVDPDTGHTWTPDVVGQPEIKPAVNTFPKVSIPVRRSERWLDPRFEGAEMRVWRDGQRQPIDQFEEPVETEERFALNGRGGVEMDQRVSKEVDQREAHLVLEDIIQANTPYTANVDTPPARTATNESVQSADTDSELSNQLQISDTDPVNVNNGELQLAQTLFIQEGESDTISGTRADGDYSGGEATFIDRAQSNTGESARVNFSTDHAIPESALAIKFRTDPVDGTGDGISDTPEFTVSIDGQTFTTEQFNTNNLSLEWRDFGASWTNGDLPAGSHTLTVEVSDAATGTADDELRFDLYTVYDDRYSYNFDNSNDGSGGYLSGPELFPDRAEVETVDAPTAFQFTGAKLSASYDDVSGGQRVGVSNDQGASYTFADNSGTVETDFGSSTAEIRGKLGLSRYGTQSGATPTSGVNGQIVDLYELFGDIDETPLLINQDYDDSLMNVVRDICQQADFISEFRKTGGTPSFEATVPGQRSSSVEPEVSGYRYSRSVEDQVKRVVVKGGRQRQREETFVANHGTAVSLDQGNIDRGTEAVYDPSTGEQFVEREDYRISPGVESDTGTITTLSSGSMTDGEAFAVDYSYHNEGVATSDDAGNNPDTLVRELPAVTAQRGCQQAATILLRQLEQPLEEAQVTIPAAAGFNVVDAQQFGPLPTGTTWEIRQITTDAGETQFSLGTRETIDEITRRIQRRLSAAASRT